MLVLSRKKDEKIIIDGDITIVVVGIQGNRVKLGIQAGPETRIIRGELAPRESIALPSEFWLEAEELATSVPLMV